MAKDLYHRKRLVQVEGETIENASRADSGHCMIADAIRKTWPDVTSVTVDLQTIRVTDRKAGKRFVYLTPSICQRQLLRFDQGVKVEPWAFHLPVRPAQVVPVCANKGNPNSMQRPSNVGKREIKAKHDSSQPLVHGGKAPPLAVLAHSNQGGHSGRKRVFGVRAAGTFDPTV